VATDVAIFHHLDEAERDAGGRLGRSAQRSFFDRMDWFRLVDRYTPEGRPLVIRARNGEATCWLFLSVRGNEAEALSNWYCLRYAAVIDGPSGKAPLADLATGLREAGISRIFLEPMAHDDPLAAELRRRGWATACGQVNVSWRIDTRGMRFDDYWASRPSRLRNTTARQAKKAKLDIIIHDRFDAAAFADYQSVYAASWKPAEGSPEFIRRLAELEGEAGTLRLGIAYKDGQAVAAQLWLVEDGVATIHKLAYREDAKEYSPGTLLSYEMFRRALDVERVDMIDFGVGNDAYKKEWMSHCVPLCGLSAYDMLRPAGMAGLAGAVWRRIAQRVRPVDAPPRNQGRPRPEPAQAPAEAA
jgi:CelD/BcsL family acetyltransferase involved in cellulose biosynthesis